MGGAGEWEGGEWGEVGKRETRMVGAREWEVGDWGDVGQRVETSSYMMNKF